MERVREPLETLTAAVEKDALLGELLQTPLMLWVAILVTMIDFFRISRMSGILLVPYIAWVSYAAVLNMSLYLLNR